MCLDTITRKAQEKRESKGFGWKVYAYDDFSDTSGFIWMKGSRIPKGRWHKADETKIYLSVNSNDNYTSGFHIFTRLKDAAKKVRTYFRRGDGVVVKVQYKEGHTYGRQWNSDVVVARKIKILKVVRK